MPELGGQFVNQSPSFQIGIGFYVEQLNAISESWKLSLNALNLRGRDEGGNPEESEKSLD